MTTVGVLTPHTAPGPEVELPEMSSGRVTTLVSRIPVPGAAPEQLREGTVSSALDAAVAALPFGSLDALAYASTSSGYALGTTGERDLVAGLRDRWHRPVVSSSLAAVGALQAYDIERVLLVHPAWFDPEAGELGASYFHRAGFDTVVARADSLPNDPAQVRPADVAEWVVAHLDERADAVVLGGNGFLAARAVDAIERRTGVLTLEANQVLLWAIFLETHTALEITGYGRLLREPARGTVPHTR